MSTRNLRALFAPRSVALVGASERPGSLGATLLANLAAGGFRCETVVLPAGEQTKSLAVASQLYDRLVALQADRQTVVIAVERNTKTMESIGRDVADA